jgi:predicted protein tyrosine phosphatase
VSQVIRFCGREEAEALCRKYAVPSVVSISDPRTARPKVQGREATLVMRFYDVSRPSSVYKPCCTPEDIQRLVEFLYSAPGPVLVHCEMGISRSAAATMIGYYLLCGDEGMARAYMMDSRERPIIHKIDPNTMMLRQADDLLGSKLREAVR